MAGVSRDSKQAANAIFRKFLASGYEVFPLNPQTPEVESVPCYADMDSLIQAHPDPVDGVVVATPPQATLDVVRQCAAHGVPRIWLHRSFGQGSVSEAAVQEARRLGITCIVGGCPLMFCDPVDLGHRCIRWWLGWRGRLPK